MKKMRVHATVWLVLFVGGFLLGFVPEYLKNRDLRSQLETPQKTIDGLRVQLQMSELRDQASLCGLNSPAKIMVWPEIMPDSTTAS